MRYYQTVTLFIILSIITMIIPTQYDYIIQKKLLKFKAKKYDKIYKLTKEIFKKEHLIKNKKDYKKIKQLSELLGLNPAKIKSNFSQNNDSIWINMFKNKIRYRINCDSNSRLYILQLEIFNYGNLSVMLSIIIMLFIFFKSKNKILSNENESYVFTSLLFFIITFSIIFFVLVKYPYLSNLLKYKFLHEISHHISKSSFYISFYVLIFDLIFLLFIAFFMLYKYRKNTQYALLWFVPVIFLLTNIYAFPRKYETNLNQYKNSKWICERGRINEVTDEIFLLLRKFIKIHTLSFQSELTLDKIGFENPIPYAKFKILSKEDKIIILGEYNKYRYKIIYNPKEDSYETHKNIKYCF